MTSGEGDGFLLIPDVVAGRDDIRAGINRLEEDILGNAEAAGGVLAVDDDEIEFQVRNEAGRRFQTAVRPVFPTMSPRKSSRIAIQSKRQKSAARFLSGGRPG